MKIYDKDDLKEMTFYRWEEVIPQKRITLIDICFIININKTLSPGNYQCSGIEIENIKSDLVPGNNYTYHYIWGENRERTFKRKYDIREISFDSIDKKQFFDWIFDYDSRLNACLRLER